MKNEENKNKNFTIVPNDNTELYKLNKAFNILHVYIVERVRSFERKGIPCYITNQQLAESTGTSEKTISRAIKLLLDQKVLWAGYHYETTDKKVKEQRILRIFNSYKSSEKKWKNENIIFKLVSKIYKNYTVIPHYQPYFLKSSFGGQMHYDIYISELNIAIEYQGRQHFEPVDYFGGIKSFKKQRIRDKEKKKLSEEHGIKLIYIKYDENITEQLIKDKIRLINGG